VNLELDADRVMIGTEECPDTKAAGMHLRIRQAVIDLDLERQQQSRPGSLRAHPFRAAAQLSIAQQVLKARRIRRNVEVADDGERAVMLMRQPRQRGELSVANRGVSRTQRP